MNDDLKPGGSGIAWRDAKRVCDEGAQAAFMAAELVALRVHESSADELSKSAADVIANEIRDLARSWAQADKLKE